MDTFFLILSPSASTVIFPVNLSLFLLTSWYVLVTGNIFLSLMISLSGGNIVTGDSVSTMNSFSVPSILIIIEMYFLRSVKCLISVFEFFDQSVSLSSVSTVSVNSLVPCPSCCSNLHALVKWPFLWHLWHFTSRAGHLWFGFQFGASQYLQFQPLCLSFDLVPYWLIYVSLCIGSSLMSFSRLDSRNSGMVFF